MVRELITIEQVLIINEELKNLSEEIDIRVKDAIALDVNEETYKEVKSVRAELNATYKKLEDKRKSVKKEVFKPYHEFEEVYKKYVTEKFTGTDEILRNRISFVEDGIKDSKREDIKRYFDEYLLTTEIDFLTFEQANISITLTASKKSLFEQVRKFIDRIQDDLILINTQSEDLIPEIMAEYKKMLNCSLAITTVSMRHKAILSEKNRIIEMKEKNNKITEAETTNILKLEAPQRVVAKIVPYPEQKELEYKKEVILRFVFDDFKKEIAFKKYLVTNNISFYKIGAEENV